MKIHELKTLPEYFESVDSGAKPFEVRFNDRDFKVGDHLCLREYSNGAYTGRVLHREISYVLDAPAYCKEGFVVLGLAPIVDEDALREIFEDLDGADRLTWEWCVDKPCKSCPYYYKNSGCQNTLKAEYLYRKGWRRKGDADNEQREAE